MGAEEGEGESAWVKKSVGEGQSVRESVCVRESVGYIEYVHVRVILQRRERE